MIATSLWVKWQLFKKQQNITMKTVHFFLLLLMTIAITSCHQETATITDINDYEQYLMADVQDQKQEIKQRLSFWNKRIKTDSMQLTALAPVAKLYTELFDTTGDITYLKLAEKTWVRAAEIAAIKKENYLMNLARNFISQHQFKKALKVAEAALVLSPDTNVKMVLFDISMELGQYTKAQQYLDQIANHTDYNFLIRLAKWSDYKGNLDATIRYMEKAKKIAESSKKKGLMLWSYTNLADYYGHAGRIQDSYEHYLDALRIDPTNAYAKKGIAWIVYSYEKNPEEALRILDAVTETYNSPDYFLLKSEIAEYQDDFEAKKKNLIMFKNAIKNESYGDMYNVYEAKLLAEEFDDFDKALEISDKEIQNRPTPLSYDLQAYVLYLNGEYQQALSIVEEFVVDRTFEPEVALHIAKIYKANHKTEEVSSLKKELLQCSYELGPMMAKKIQNL